MFAQERHKEIIDILNKEGKVVVKELSRKFNLTEDCIRKDLKFLEGKRLLKRTYGGAIPVRKPAQVQDIELRKHKNVESKLIIAKKAFNIIEENDTIFLDISTTNILLAEEILKQNKKVTVITNMLDIVSILRNANNNVKVICIGGVLNKELNSFTGSAAIENMSDYRPDKAFIGSCGVNIFDKSITTFDVEDGNTKKSILKNSRKSYLVMENSKFYFDGTYKFSSLYDINGIITDDEPGKDILKLIGETDTVVI